MRTLRHDCFRTREDTGRRRRVEEKYSESSRGLRDRSSREAQGTPSTSLSSVLLMGARSTGRQSGTNEKTEIFPQSVPLRIRTRRFQLSNNHRRSIDCQSVLSNLVIIWVTCKSEGALAEFTTPSNRSSHLPFPVARFIHQHDGEQSESAARFLKQCRIVSWIVLP